MVKNMAEFRDNIKNLRKTLGYTQIEFGKIIGVSQQVLSDLENGKSNPSKTLVKYLEYRFGDKMGGLDNVTYLDPATERFDRAIKNLGIDPNEFDEEERNAIITIIRKELEKHEKSISEKTIGIINVIKKREAK